MANVLSVNDDNFAAEVLQADKPVLVDFGATWCGPCKQLAPIVEQLAGEYSGRLKVAVIDVEDAKETAMRYGVMSVPTLLFFRGGEVKEQVIGFTSKSSLQEKIDRVIG